LIAEALAWLFGTELDSSQDDYALAN